MVKIETRSRIPIWRTFGRIPWHVIPQPSATLQGVIIPSAILKIVFRQIIYFFGFFNAVWALTSGGFRIVSGTLVFTARCIARTMPSQGVRLFVLLSHTGIVSIKLLAPEVSHTILVFPYHTLYRYSDGDPLTGLWKAGRV